MKSISSCLSHIFLVLAVLGLICIPAGSRTDEEEPLYQETWMQPPAPINDFLSRSSHIDRLEGLSPDGTRCMIPVNADFSSLKLMTQRTLRLGMLEICPDVNREWRLSTSGVTGLKIYSLSERMTIAVKIPDGAFISDMTWSPDGKAIAFLAHQPDATRVWIADTATGKTSRLCKAPVMATLTGQRGYGRSATAPSRMLQWTPSGNILTLLVPGDRGPEPRPPVIPPTPIIRHTRRKATPTSTYPFLLRTPHDQALFRYFTTAQLAELSPGKSPRPIGKPAMYTSLSLSPDGRHILAEKLTEPFSYIAAHRSFPRELFVMDREGTPLAVIRKTPLQEGSRRDRGTGPAADLPREVAWRPDGKGLSFLWREPKKKTGEGDGATEEKDDRDDRMDRLMLLTPPFSMDAAQTLITSRKRLSQTAYAPNGRHVFARLSGRGEDCRTGTDIAAFDLTQSPPGKILLLRDIETEDPVKLPGELVTQVTGNGIEFALVSSDDSAVYLTGSGYRKDLKPRPFVDRVEIATGKIERVFEGSADVYERPLSFPDNDLGRLIINRESPSLLPDSWLWIPGEAPEKLTANRNPFPEFAESRRIDFVFTRRDGLECRARIVLPPGYSVGTRVPGVFWTYPREYTSPGDYDRSVIRGRNLNAFQRMSWRNASDIWLSQGYAVITPDIPIIGKGDTYNNNYVAHLVDSMYAAIRKVDELGFVDVDRLGHGGHSYGAFATANILARSPFFKAGIAGDGAYNRTLTPMAFQSERRYIWEAQDVYLEMSPFFQADHIDTPLLMYHGAADNNTGTFLIQSERFIQALTGLGKNAVLYIYPFESHGPRCIETYRDMWARWSGFFDKYVKQE